MKWVIRHKVNTGYLAILAPDSAFTSLKAEAIVFDSLKAAQLAVELLECWGYSTYIETA